MDVQRMQSNYENARKWKQYPIATVAGTVAQEISLPGTARGLLGLIITGFTTDALLTMTVNNMVLCQDAPLSTFQRNTSEPVHTEILLKVTGNDVIQIVVTDTGVQNLRFNFAYV
jgi:hypothetical protein